MASSGKHKTTMAKLTREAKLRERRVEKNQRKQIRKDTQASQPYDPFGAPHESLAGLDIATIEGFDGGKPESLDGGTPEGFDVGSPESAYVDRLDGSGGTVDAHTTGTAR